MLAIIGLMVAAYAIARLNNDMVFLRESSRRKEANIAIWVSSIAGAILMVLVILLLQRSSDSGLLPR